MNKGLSTLPKSTLDTLMLLFNQGRYLEIINTTKDLIIKFPRCFKLFSIIGAAHKGMGNLANAELSFRKACELEPLNSDAHNNLGFVLAERGDYEQAICSYSKVLKILPNDFESHVSLGNLLLRKNRYDEAVRSYDNALKINPNSSLAYNNMGNAFSAKGDLDQALLSYNSAIRCSNEFSGAYNNIGNILKEKFKYDEAIDFYHRAIELDAKFADAYYNLADTLVVKGLLDQAVVQYKKAIEIDPTNINYQLNIGNTYRAQGKLQDALRCYEKVVCIEPNFFDALYNISLLRLKRKEWVAGWQGYEYRFDLKKDAVDKLIYQKPRWDKKFVEKLFVWGEQGVGDEIMFASCINELRHYTDRLIVSCDERLLPLYNRSFDQSISFINKSSYISDDLFDSQISIGSAYGYFRQTNESFEARRMPYLKADSKRRDDLREKIESKVDGASIIGISWRSSASKDAKKRSLNVSDLADAIPKNFGLVNLQYGEVVSDIESLAKVSGRKVFTANDIDNFNHLDDFCALIQACDLVVSIDNSTVHFAGALGTKCHVLLPFSHQSDWRWGLNGTPKSYQYANMYLHWQTKPEDWQSCLSDLNKKLVV